MSVSHTKCNKRCLNVNPLFVRLCVIWASAGLGGGRRRLLLHVLLHVLLHMQLLMLLQLQVRLRHWLRLLPAKLLLPWLRLLLRVLLMRLLQNGWWHRRRQCAKSLPRH